MNKKKSCLNYKLEMVLLLLKAQNLIEMIQSNKKIKLQKNKKKNKKVGFK